MLGCFYEQHAMLHTSLHGLKKNGLTVPEEQQAFSGVLSAARFLPGSAPPLPQGCLGELCGGGAGSSHNALQLKWTIIHIILSKIINL